jgi:hypothetical protein
MKMAVFWVVAPCSLVEVYQRFRGTFWLHHQGAASTSEMSVNFYQTTRRNNPEDRHLHTCRREILKSHPDEPSSHGYTYFFKLCFNIDLSFMTRSPMRSLLCMNYTTLPCALHAPPISSSPDLIIVIIFGKENELRSSSSRNFSQSPVPPSLFMSKHSPEHPVPKHPQYIFVFYCEKLSFTPIQNCRYKYSFVYFSLYIRDWKTKYSDLSGGKCPELSLLVISSWM